MREQSIKCMTYILYRGSADFILPKFPVTYAKSALGFKLTEEELRERSKELDVFMRVVICQYVKLVPEAQDLVLKFLILDGFALGLNDECEQYKQK